MFQLKDVTFAYPGKASVFENLNIYIAEGEFTLLKGPSGSGKTTFLHLLNGLAVPQKGEILFQGRLLSSYDPTLLRRRVVYLQQLPVMIDASVRENLLLPFTLKSAGKTALPGDELLYSYLRTFLLQDVTLEDNACNLSVGQRQRLALVRALLLEPEVLLLDEPTASLDRESREIVEEKVELLNLEKEMGIIMISHTDYVPKRIRPRVLVFRNGGVREEG